MKTLFFSFAVAVVIAGCASDDGTLTHTIDRGNVVRPTVAISNAAHASAVGWMRQDSDGWNVYVSTLEIGKEPGIPVRVNHLTGNASPHDEAPAQVALGPDGEVYVAWANRIDVEGRRFPASNLLFSVSTDGGTTFSPEKAINADAEESTSSHTFHDMIVLTDGTILVSWIDSRERDRYLREHGPQTLSEAPAKDPHKAMHGVGLGTDAGTPPGSQIRVARSVDGGRMFQETAVVDNDSCPCCRTALAAGAAGEVYLGWRHVFENGDRDIVVARSNDGGRTFEPMVRVAEDGWKIDACPHAGPALTVGDGGRLHVAWYTGAENEPGLFHAHSDDGGRSFSVRLPIATGIPMAYADMSGSSDRTPHIVYHIPSDKQTVVASIGPELAGALTHDGGRASIASARGTTVAAGIRAGQIVVDIIRS